MAVKDSLPLQQSTGANQSNGGKSQPSQPMLDQSDSGLRITAQEFLATIENGGSLELLRFWADSGVSLGVDMEDRVVSKNMLREQIEKKGELFCFFFDSDCLRKIRNESRRRAHKTVKGITDYSCRELLKRAKGRTLHVSERREGDTLAGYVQVHLDGELTKLNSPRELNFTFIFEKGGWKLAEVPYY
jgi:hypothetical protein